MSTLSSELQQQKVKMIEDYAADRLLRSIPHSEVVRHAQRINRYCPSDLRDEQPGLLGMKCCGRLNDLWLIGQYQLLRYSLREFGLVAVSD